MRRQQQPPGRCTLGESFILHYGSSMYKYFGCRKIFLGHSFVAISRFSPDIQWTCFLGSPGKGIRSTMRERWKTRNLWCGCWNHSPTVRCCSVKRIILLGVSGHGSAPRNAAAMVSAAGQDSRHSDPPGQGQTISDIKLIALYFRADQVQTWNQIQYHSVVVRYWCYWWWLQYDISIYWCKTIFVGIFQHPSNFQHTLLRAVTHCHGHPSRALGSKCKRKGQCHDGVCQENPRVAPSGGGWLAAGVPHLFVGGDLRSAATIDEYTHRHQGAAAGQPATGENIAEVARTACTERGRQLGKAPT